MASDSRSSVTLLLEKVNAGDRQAINALFPFVYEELRRIAYGRKNQWQGDNTLNTTALVHEAYLKLVDQEHQKWNSRAHFFGVASKAMRHIMIDYAKRRRTLKRGGEATIFSLDELRAVREGEPFCIDEQADVLIAIDQALDRLAEIHPRLGRIVECRFFAAMTIEETAEALEISEATVKRDWKMAQSWLYRALKEDSQGPQPPGK